MAWVSLPSYITIHKSESYLKTIRERAQSFIRQPWKHRYEAVAATYAQG